MSLLDTLTIIFQSNAKEAVKDIKALDKASNDFEKGEKERTKEEKERLNLLKEQKNAVQDLVQNLTTLAASYMGMSAIKNGVLKSADFNNTLFLQSKLTEQNAEDVAVLGQMYERFGGSAAGMQAWITSTTLEFAKTGRALPPIIEIFDKLNKIAQSGDNTQKQRLLQMYNITDPAMILMLSQSAEEYRKQKEKMENFGITSPEGIAAARQFNDAWKDMRDAFQGVYNIIAETILPTVSSFITMIADATAKNKTFSAILTSVVGAFLGLASIIVGGRLAIGLLGLTTLASQGAVAFSGLAAAILRVSAAFLATPLGKIFAAAAAASAIVEGASAGGRYIGNKIKDTETGLWLRKKMFGYETSSQAEQTKIQPYDLNTKEGQARALLDVCGENGVKDGYVQSMGTVQYDENDNPIWSTLQPVVDGKAAINAASSSNIAYSNPVSNNSASSSVSIGAINVQSNASDPRAVAEEVRNELQKHYAQPIAQRDDSVRY